MSKMSPSSITNLWILSGIFVLAAVGAWLFLNWPWDRGSSVKNLFYRDLEVFAEQMRSRWLEGDREGGYGKGKFACSSLIGNDQPIHFSYFQCNPLYMLCFARGETGTQESAPFEFLDHAFGRRGDLILRYRHKSSGAKAALRFKDTCSTVTLPQAIYSAGPLEGSSMLWDNVGQSIWMDKNYVTNGQVRIWKNKLEAGKGAVATDHHLPSTDLSLEERKSYCMWRGGQLMQSRHFDAASFLPSPVENQYVYKFPYPWTKSRNAILELGDKDCRKIFSKECASSTYEHHSTYSPSWAGIYHALGSYSEVFDNKFFPPANVKISSMHLPLESPWHRLGLRYSTESETDLSSYNGRSLEEPPAAATEAGRAFRCVGYL